MPSWNLSVSLSEKIQPRLSRMLFLGISTCFVSFGGCSVVGPDFVQPDIQTLSTEYQAKNFQHQPAITLDHWWQNFADPTLDQLVSQALSNNLTVQVAAERIIEARANVNLNGGALAPNVNCVLDYRPLLGRKGSRCKLFNLGLDSTWEIDLFGRLERSMQAAELELLAQEYSLQSVQQTLVADVATSYLSIRLLQSQIQIVDQSLQLQEETNQVVSGRADAGVSTKLDAEQTVAFLHRSRADKAGLELLLNCEFNRLSILLGESPNSAIQNVVGVGEIPEAPYIPEAGIPADLIRRRPDVQRSEVDVAAASIAQVGIVQADLCPPLNFNIKPSFSRSVLHFGRIRDSIEIHESRLRQTVGSYRATVLEAVKEVEDAMVKHDGYRKQLVSLDNAVQSDAKAVELSLQRYKVGKSNFQRVLDSQLQLLKDSQALSTARANANVQLIRLYRALGGGWSGQMTAGGGCAQCAATQGSADCDCWSGNQTVAFGSDVNQQSGIQRQQTIAPPPSAVGFDTAGEVSAKPHGNFFDSNLPQDQHQNLQKTGKTILRFDEVPPPNSRAISTPQNGVLPTDDFSPLEFRLDLGNVQQQETGGLTGKNVTNELFNWSEQDKAVVKSMSQSRSRIQRVTSAGYFVDSPEDSNKQETQKASSTRPAALEWVSEAMKGY